MEKKGTKTLLLSVIMSAPGPLVLGIGQILGKSSTQLADLVRRSIELLALIVSYLAYRVTVKRQLGEEQTVRLERKANLFVGGTMLLAGLIMLGLTLFTDKKETGNVMFGLIIALLGAAANTMFWFRYRRLAKAEHSAILDVQARLYRAKSLVDLCVTAALFSVWIAPASRVSQALDRVGSAVVSVYLAYSGVKIVVEKLTERGGTKR